MINKVIINDFKSITRFAGEFYKVTLLIDFLLGVAVVASLPSLESFSNDDNDAEDDAQSKMILYFIGEIRDFFKWAEE